MSSTSQALRLHRLLPAIGLCLVGCSGGGGGSGSSTEGGGGQVGTTKQVERYFDAPANTQLQARGTVRILTDGSEAPVGTWEEWHPNGVKQFDRVYVDGQWDRQQSYVEWNDDQSIRDTWTDGE